MRERIQKNKVEMHFRSFPDAKPPLFQIFLKDPDDVTIELNFLGERIKEEDWKGKGSASAMTLKTGKGRQDRDRAAELHARRRFSRRPQGRAPQLPRSRRPGPGEVVIEMKASGMCGSDLKFYRSPPGAAQAALGLGGSAEPFIAGHEPCGVVVARGPGVPRSEAPIGQRVMDHHYAGCGVCPHCRVGWSQLCRAGITVYGVTAHGGHADYLKVPARTIVELPEELSFAEGAAVACGTGTAYGALRRMRLAAATRSPCSARARSASPPPCSASRWARASSPSRPRPSGSSSPRSSAPMPSIDPRRKIRCRRSRN